MCLPPPPPYPVPAQERDWPGSGSFDSADSGGECGIPTQTRFPSPTQSSHMQDQANTINRARPPPTTPSARSNPHPASISQGWWSIEHGSATIIMSNTEMQVGPGSDQYVFFEETLKAVDRSITPWVIFLGHRPMYWVSPSAAGGYRDPMFGAFEGLLMQYKVDLVLWGHVHNAFASCPMYNSSCVTAPAPGAYDAPVHACIGNAGQGLSGVNNATKPDWVRWQMNEWGYSSIHLWNATTLTMNLYNETDSTVQHEIVISRTFPRT